MRTPTPDRPRPERARGRRPAAAAAARAALVRRRQLDADRLRQLPDERPRALFGDRARRQALPDLAPADDDRPGDREKLHLRPRARPRPARLRHRRLGRRPPRESRAPRRTPASRSASRPSRSTAYAAANPGTRARHEDHVGYKVDYENDVRLLSASGVDLSVTCDYLVSVHQGSHSPDALSNNVHELLYAVRCDDGTELIADTISRFGQPGSYVRACDTSQTVTTTDNGYPAGGGRREIPDRACVEQTVLVPAGRTTSAWALYEKWSAVNELKTGRRPHAGDVRPGLRRLRPEPLRQPSARPRDWAARSTSAGRSRATATAPTRRSATARPTTAACRPRTPTTTRARRSAASTATSTCARRGSTTPAARGSCGPTRTAAERRATPFPGALCQLVATVDNGDRPALQERVYGRNRPNADAGVHAPN